MCACSSSSELLRLGGRVSWTHVSWNQYPHLRCGDWLPAFHPHFLGRSCAASMRLSIGWLRFGAAFVVIAGSTTGAIPARATDVVSEWSTIQMPPPTSKPVAVDSKSTALFLLDFMHENCGQRCGRPDCMNGHVLPKRLK